MAVMGMGMLTGTPMATPMGTPMSAPALFDSAALAFDDNGRGRSLMLVC
jgi:hypothetical protein